MIKSKELIKHQENLNAYKYQPDILIHIKSAISDIKSIEDQETKLKQQKKDIFDNCKMLSIDPTTIKFLLEESKKSKKQRGLDLELMEGVNSSVEVILSKDQKAQEDE